MIEYLDHVCGGVDLVRTHQTRKLKNSDGFGGIGKVRVWAIQDLLYKNQLIGLDNDDKEEGELEEGEISTTDIDQITHDQDDKEEGDLEEGEIATTDIDQTTHDHAKEAATPVSFEAGDSPAYFSADRSKFGHYADEIATALKVLNHVNSAVSAASTNISAPQTPSTTRACDISSETRALARRRDPRRPYVELKQPHATIELPKVEITKDGPAAKRQRTGIHQLKPLDPRRVLFSGNVQSATLPVRCSTQVETNKNVYEQFLEGEAKMKRPPSNATTPDIIRQDTENPKDTNAMTPTLFEDVSFEASQIQRSDDSVTTSSKSRTTLNDVKHLLDQYDDNQVAEILQERERRYEEQNKMFAERKLCLVLDLDHTLLNSAKFSEIDPVHEEILRWKEEQERQKPDRHLFRLPHMALWTKLRPGIWNFLEKASKLCELHVCTMGNKLYAAEMAKIIDPKGVLFAGRVISKADDGNVSGVDDRVFKTKDLDGVLGMESSIVIMDDCKIVWPHNRPNLIAVERYIYFPCSRVQFGLRGQSLLEIDHDERPEDGALASYLGVIERLHKTFFSPGDLHDADVRVILADEQRKILNGCRIVFSHVFPVAEVNPHVHPLWKLAEQFGASCTNRIDDKVTHVVANSPGTDKVKWALYNGRFVVRPNWVEASALLFRRAMEQDFAVIPQGINLK